MEMKICDYLYNITVSKKYTSETSMYRLINPKLPSCSTNLDEISYSQFLHEYYYPLCYEAEQGLMEKLLDCEKLNKLNKKWRILHRNFVDSIPSCELSNWAGLCAIFPEYQFDEEHFCVSGPNMPQVSF